MIVVRSVEDFDEYSKFCVDVVTLIWKRTEVLLQEISVNEYSDLMLELRFHSGATLRVLNNARQNIRLIPARASDLLPRIDEVLYMINLLRRMPAYKSQLEMNSINASRNLHKYSELGLVDISGESVTISILVDYAISMISSMRAYLSELIYPPDLEVGDNGRNIVEMPIFTPSQIASPVRFIVVNGILETISISSIDPSVKKEMDDMKKYILNEIDMIVDAMQGANIDPQYRNFVNKMKYELSKDDIDVIKFGSLVNYIQSSLERFEENNSHAAYLLCSTFVSNASRYCTTFHEWSKFMSNQYRDVNFEDVVLVKGLLVEFCEYASAEIGIVSGSALSELSEVCNWEVYEDTEDNNSKNIKSIWYVYMTTCYNFIAAAYGEIMKNTYGRIDLMRAKLQSSNVMQLTKSAVHIAKASHDSFISVKNAAWLPDTTNVISGLIEPLGEEST